MLKHAKTDEDIARCFPVMAELRTHLQPESFVSLVRQLEQGGYRLAYVENGNGIVAVAGYRISTNLFLGKNLYVDDLVTADRVRSQGYGEILLSSLRDIARANDCAHFHLDSGTQRKQAHKFYFRQGMTISSYHFDEKLTR
ncbi:MAG: GNAT family N-acetyltransferase [Gammaproteobacteria bacterium]|nr:GNAT family N-acetyltransferase [Gammaproteobacteria bacterium]MDH3768179.1 GNAT family N-acetyltransferase [Gammaproteobacteria bacterium]